MNAIIGMTELVLDSRLDAEQREYLEMVLESGNSLLGLLNDILDFSKIEAGKLDLEPIDFELRQWLADCVKSLAFRAKQKNLYLRCEIAAETPEWLNGDPHRLRQILVNLISNAIKFTETGGVTIRVLPLTQGGRIGILRFEVHDTGIGVPKGKWRTIFEEFEQADSTTKRKYGGTGLGLAICSRLVAMMRGEIGVESDEGQGSTFFFTARFGLPARKPSEDSAATPEAVAAAVGSEGPPLLVLLAEDSQMNQRLAIGLLQKKGHRVVVAANGKLAVETFKTERFDMVLMDVQMPEMDGFEATQAIRALEAPDERIPIIAMTAHAMKGDRERCLKAGMDGYLAKPIRAADLYRILDKYASNKATFHSV
jgi:CheY-like chemotaxis protein